MDINKLIIDLISNPLFSLIFPLIIAAVVKFWFDRKIEKVKSNHAADTFQFQTEINSLKDRENFKFNKLHDKRFEVLRDTYSLLNKSLACLRIYIAPAKFVPENTDTLDMEDDQNEQFRTSHQVFCEFYNDNIIYFDKATVSLIDSYILQIIEVYGDYHNKHVASKMGLRADGEIMSAAAFAYKKIPEKIEPIKIQIQNKFRELLGE